MRHLSIIVSVYGTMVHYTYSIQYTWSYMFCESYRQIHMCVQCTLGNVVNIQWIPNINQTYPFNRILTGWPIDWNTHPIDACFMCTLTRIFSPIKISRTYTSPILVIHITYHIDLSTYTCARPLRNHLLKLKLYEWNWTCKSSKISSIFSFLFS